MSVSKALRGHADMAPETVERVKRVAAEMGYVPNHFARSLQAQGGSKLLGVVVPKIRHAFFAESLGAIQEAAAEQGYEILFGVSQEQPSVERRHVETFVSMRVEGLLVSVSERRDELLSDYRWLAPRGVPLVYFDRAPCDLQSFEAVTMDDRGGAHDAVLAAAALGRTRIAHLAGYDAINIGRERRAGYEAGMRAAGLSINPDWVITGGLAEADGYQAFERLWSQAERPDAIFCASFPLAVGVADAMRALAPEAIGKVLLMFFGVAEMARFFPEPYICVVQPAAAMGRVAVDRILHLIQDREMERHPPLPVHLMASPALSAPLTSRH